MNTLVTAVLCAITFSAAHPASSAPAEPRLFEMRTYYAAPEKLDALHARFRDHTCKLFARHGMANIGYWVPTQNPDRKLIYLLAYPDRAARDASWKAFMADPDWQRAYRASEVDGKLVSRAESLFLVPTDYSPALRPVLHQPARTFELRTYQASPGNLAALNARFRDHTLKLFARHGITNLGYWNYAAGQKEADHTLVYLLAHATPEAAAASFQAFRADPDWRAAREASEKNAGGSLTLPNGVKSDFLVPTDYSPMR